MGKQLDDIILECFSWTYIYLVFKGISFIDLTLAFREELRDVIMKNEK